MDWNIFSKLDSNSTDTEVSDLTVTIGVEFPRVQYWVPQHGYLYINSMAVSISNLKETMYADDVSIAFKNKSVLNLEIDS